MFIICIRIYINQFLFKCIHLVELMFAIENSFIKALPIIYSADSYLIIIYLQIYKIKNKLCLISVTTFKNTHAFKNSIDTKLTRKHIFRLVYHNKLK